MDYINIRFLAVGYYSDARYEENIIVSKNFFQKMKEKDVFKGFEVYIPDLDGKYSEVLGEISFLETARFDNDGERFLEALSDRCEEVELNLVDGIIEFPKDETMFYKISEKELKRLLYDSTRLGLLDMGGVDNWSWYGTGWNEFLLEMIDGRLSEENIPKDIEIDDIVELDLKEYERI